MSFLILGWVLCQLPTSFHTQIHIVVSLKIIVLPNHLSLSPSSYLAMYFIKDISNWHCTSPKSICMMTQYWSFLTSLDYRIYKHIQRTYTLCIPFSIFTTLYFPRSYFILAIFLTTSAFCLHFLIFHVWLILPIDQK